MDYIASEEFNKQPTEVQEVLRKWHCKYNELKCIVIGTPIMAETEIRKFIEQTTGGYIGMCRVNREGRDFYTLCIWKGNELAYLEQHEDLLMAYWKMAINIAKDGVRRQKV